MHLKKELRKYQVEALEFISRNFAKEKNAGLFLDMGLGKTIVALYAALEEMPKPILLIGPIRVIEDVWRQEAEDWEQVHRLKFVLLRGTASEWWQQLRTSADIYLLNCEMLDPFFSLPPGVRPAVKSLIVDESSMFKDPSTKRFKVLRKSLPEFECVLILTGTPTPNSILELWSQIFILDRGKRLEVSKFQFTNRYFEKDYMGWKFTPLPGAEDKIINRISDIVMRIEASQALPSKGAIHNKVFLQLPSAIMTKYRQLEKEAFTIINDKQISVTAAIAAFIKLRQVASGFVYDDSHNAQVVHRLKLDALDEVLRETGSPIICLYQFDHEQRAILNRFKFAKKYSSGIKTLWNQGKIPLMIMHPQSAGYGLNLQYGGHTMVVFSGSFSQEQMTQAFHRIDRQGQKYPCVFHHLLARGTIDELMHEVIVEKAKNQASLLERLKHYASNNHRRS